MKNNESYEIRQKQYAKNLADFNKATHRKEITFNINNNVSLADNMILYSVSNLKPNEFKLLRFFIMQCEMHDKEIYPYTVDVKQLAEVIGANEKVLYRELKKIAMHLMKEVIYIKGKTEKDYIMYHWVDLCQYQDCKFTMKISDELKPFMLDLKNGFTNYPYFEIMGMHSIYALSLYEMFATHMKYVKPHADVAIEFSVSIEELRRITNTTNKFERYSNFKAKVIDLALKEINECSNYFVTATPYKDGKTIAGFDFLIESQAGYIHKTKGINKNKKIEVVDDNLEGQMNLMDYQTSDNKFEITKG